MKAILFPNSIEATPLIKSNPSQLNLYFPYIAQGYGLHKLLYFFEHYHLKCIFTQATLYS